MKSLYLWTAVLLGLPTLLQAAAPKPTHPPVPAVEPIAGQPFLHAGPLVGHVTDSTAKLWAKASNASTLGFKIGETTDLKDAREIDGPQLEAAQSFTGQVSVTQLKPATRYYYLPLLNGKAALAPPYPSFFTTSPADSLGTIRIAFGSCVGPRGYSAAAAFGEMGDRRNFDLLLMLGDNHYGDTTDPSLLRDHYFMHRKGSGFERLIRHIPTYAIWDDHDYGPNNSDGTSAGKAGSLDVFRQWWANPGYGEPDNPGCYYHFNRSGIDFFMLDVRYYRTPNKAPNDPSKTMLGTRQLTWLKDQLSKSKARFKVIGSGSEWQTLTQPDCWSSFASERQEIFDHITSNQIEGVVLLSGDRHFTAGYQVQGRHLEFTTGPLGSGNATLQENPERFTGCDEGKLWAILELDGARSGAGLTYEVWQAGGGLLERRTLGDDEVNGRQKISLSPPLLPDRMESKQGR